MTVRPPRRIGDAEVAESYQLLDRLRGSHPPLLRALTEDARSFAARRGERFEFTSAFGKWLNALRLLWTSDQYLGLALYRLRGFLQRKGMPIVPRILHIIDMSVFRITIGEHVVVREGVYVPHGDILIDGLVYIGRHCVIGPFSTIGLVEGDPRGPWIEDNVTIGTGARVLGPIRVGEGARIGANAVVVDNVPPGVTAVGVPARFIQTQANADDSADEL